MLTAFGSYNEIDCIVVMVLIDILL